MLRYATAGWRQAGSSRLGWQKAAALAAAAFGEGAVVVTYESKLTRPDLPVPLSPSSGISLFVRRHLLGLRVPSFARAHRATLALAVAGLLVAVVSLLIPPRWQKAVFDVSALIGLYVIIRALATVAFERRQHSFEPVWMNAQSDVLRGHAFEVLRFTIRDSSEDQRARMSYDLSRPDDVSMLLRRQAQERSSGRPSKATVEFAYLTGEGTLAVADVHRDLPDLTFVEGRAGRGYTWVRFPEAQYVVRQRHRTHPAQRTNWALSGPVLIGVSQAAAAGQAGLARAPGAAVGSSGSGSSR